MPTLLFWLIVIAGILFWKLTTKDERRALVLNYWVILTLIGIIGFAAQLLRQGTFSS